MSDFSANLQLPYLMPAQAQKHVTVNQSLRRLDALVQMRAQSRTTAAQPATPGDGELWILPAGKSGADWDGFAAGRIAFYRDGAWEEITPRAGWTAFVIDAGSVEVFDGTDWVSAAGAAGALLEDDCASPASLKAVDQGLATGAAPRFQRLGVNTAPGAHRSYVYTTSNEKALLIQSLHASLVNDLITLGAGRIASSAFHFLQAYSGVGGSPDTEFRLAGDGAAYADGSWSGGGADYAEYFEWSDGNPGADDRRGLPVVVDPEAAGKIRIADPDDDPARIIGAVSANPTVIGDSAWNRWAGKYLCDAFGACLWEEYDVATWSEPPPEEGGEPVARSFPLDALPEGVAPPADAVIATARRRVLNPDYDPGVPYVPRQQRREWAAVGLVGKLRIRAGQPVGARWLKLRDVSGAVEEWLVR